MIISKKSNIFNKSRVQTIQMLLTYSEVSEGLEGTRFQTTVQNICIQH